MNNIITGTDLEINVGKNYKSKLNIKSGNTYQATRSGKNLYNIFDINAVATSGVTIDKDGWITITCDNSSGTTTKIFDCMVNTNSKLSTSTSYNIITEVKSKSGTGYLTINEGGRQDTQITTNLIYNIGTLSNNTIYNRLVTSNSSFDSSANIVRQYAYFDAGQSGSITYRISLLADTSITPETFTYEPYGVMPSPDYPSRIRNVGDNINEFDKNNVNKLSAYSWSGSTIANGVNDFYLLYIPCKANTIYTIQKKAGQRFVLTTTAEIPAIGVQTYGFVQNNTETKLSIETPSNAKYLVIEYYRASTDTLTEQEILDSIKIEEGSIPTQYTPYNCGSADFKVENKNILDVNKLASANADKTYAGYGFWAYKITEELGKYTLSRKDNATISGTGYICIGTGENLSIAYTNKIWLMHPSLTSLNNQNITIDNKKELWLFTSSSESKIEETLVNCGYLQLEKNTQPTPYTPHQEQIKSFPFTEGQVLHKGDYLASDGIHQKRKTLVLNGTENWIAYTSTGIFKYVYYLEISDSKVGWDTSICSQFKNVHYAWNEGTGSIGYYSDHPSVKRKYFCTDKTTLTEWKSYLAEQYANGTPVTIEYELAEEIVTPYTTEQKEAYYELQNIYLYQDKNYIYCIDEIEPDIELIYFKEVEECDCYISENGYLIIKDYEIEYLVDFNESNIPSMPEATETSVRIAGRDGDIPLKTVYEPMNFNIVCYTEDNLTFEEKRKEENKIDMFMDSIKNKTIRFGIESDNKFYNVKYNALLTTINFPKHLKFSIPLKSSESYAKDLTEKNIIGNNYKESNTIKDVGAVFTILGPAQTPKISLNDYIMEYNNVLLENTKLIIDSNKSTITHINSSGVKTNAMRYYNHQFPKIQKGKNKLKVLSGINNINNVIVRWNDLKL